MSENLMSKYGLFSVCDTGAPIGSECYSTLMIVHGLAWHAGVFCHLLPLASKNNSRVILVNRRDYPGAVPFNDEELQLLSSVVPDTPEAANNIKTYMKARAKELYDFMQTFVETEDIPVDGGLVLAGWSLGAAWITALLTHISTFPVNDIELHAYIRRVVLYDPPYHTLGYPPPAEFYNPLSEPSLAPGEGVKLFPAWVSGYYRHGESSSELEHRVSLSEPSPTILTMSNEDLSKALYPAPANPGGSDAILLEAGIRHGLYKTLREGALYPPTISSHNVSINDWSDVELRYLWCDRSVWEMPWGTWAFQREIEEAKKSGKSARKVTVMRLRGANHFAHWDQPERTIQALLSDRTDEH